MGHSYLRGESAVNIAASVEDAVRSGIARPGDRLPSVRDAADLLGVSRNTVAFAYGRLRDGGIIRGGAGRGGMRIAATLPFEGRAVALPAGVRDAASGNVDAAFLPRLEDAIARIDLSPSGYDVDRDDPALIAVARERLGAEGLDTRHLCFASGALDAIERAIRARVRPGSTVMVEDPGFPPLFDLLRAMGLRLKPVPLDEEGPDPAALEAALAAGAAAVVLTPRAQNPTGIDVGAARAAALSAIFARHPDALVILDDHWGPLAEAPLALPPPAGGRWMVVRSVSKFLGPDYRVAVALGDATTIDRVRRQQALGPRWVSRLLQRIVAALWRDPASARLLEEARLAYRERRAALLAELARAGIAGFGRSGAHVWIPVTHETEVTRGMLAAGWAVRPGEPFRLASGPAVRVGLANLTPASAAALGQDLARLLAGSRRPAG